MRRNQFLRLDRGAAASPALVTATLLCLLTVVITVALVALLSWC